MTTLIDSGFALLDLDSDGIAWLRLNRPEAANGMSVEFLQAVHAAIMRCHVETAIRAVVLTGEGKNFCAGGDVRTFAAQGANLPDYIREATAWLQTTASALTQLRPPVIAAVHGFAAGGGGFGLVCAADFVIAAESARFMPAAVNVGMVPDAGSTVTLTQIVGLRKAMQIFVTNPTLTAAEALEVGLLTKVVPDDALLAEAFGLAHAIAAGAPAAIAETKRLVWRGLGSTLDAQLPEEARAQSELARTADAHEGLAAVLERRKPIFTGK
ncbi:enoyl-CoA hydratase/isomerase family protein [Amycolatopsis sp.]|jgi:2-(1,2-epoxy-1,2-dihydrophenyl)acetyl-CoA isomerase|uniref:enoyl-CoA hydratase/isomerase family protein n=1 Tax=Amycolatopsis sp. TaxID=37632 RepID=UPI002E0A4EED|nr:enoyl-CoA hydratase-related protein [Amycolatopsis sp.]